MPTDPPDFEGEETPVSRPHSIARYPLRRRSQQPHAPNMDQWEFTAPFEGVVPHLYLDTKGLPTCGVGFLVASSAELVALPWQPNSQIALVDYYTVRRCEAGHAAQWYGKFCKAYLPEPAMREIFERKTHILESMLASRWRLSSCPAPARVALVDMAYNLGVGRLNKFDNLHAAVVSGNWHEAAKECHRTGIQEARNVATSALFGAAAESGQ